MGFVLFERFQGIRTDVDPKTTPTALQECSGLDIDRERTKLFLQKGLKSIGSINPPSPNYNNIDSIVEWQNQEDSSDNLLVYDKQSTLADRRLHWLKRTINDKNSSYVKQFEFKYRSVSLETLSYLPWRGGLRIGTGNGNDNKALLFAYYDRTGDNAMFGGLKSFSGNFPSLQQWVQQAELFGRALSVLYDSCLNKYYLLTERGIEIRDEHFFIEQIIEDVVAFENDTQFYGGLAFTDRYLYAVGENPSAPGDFLVVAYNTDEGYKKINSVSYSSPLRATDVWADNNNVYVVTFDTTSGSEQLDVIVYASDLTGATTIYSNAVAGREPAFGITGDVNYVYVLDNQIPGILRIERTAPYGTSTLSFSGVNILSKLDITKNKDFLYALDIQPNNTRILEVEVATFSSYNVKATKDGKLVSISFPFDCKYYSLLENKSIILDRKRNEVWTYTATDFSSLTNLFPRKVSATIDGVDSLSNQESFFYGFSIVDIWGQEYHLMTGLQISCVPNLQRTIRLYLNIYSETVQGTPGGVASSSNINDLESAWDIFRRIKKIKVYRAYNSAKHAAWPFTSYRFLKEIDINSDQWVEELADSRYYIDIVDDVDEADISTVSYEESAKLPERFKPYFVNWAHATKFGNFFYFGNLYVDEALPNTFVRSTYLSPDVVYMLDDNWVNTEASGDSGITGMYEYSNRIAVLKRSNLLIFNDLNFDLSLNVGSYSREAFLPFGTRFFVANENGVFIGNFSGFKKISIPIDNMLAKTNRYWLAFDYEDNKLLFFDGVNVFAYDLSNGIWTKRDYAFIDAGGVMLDPAGLYQSLYGEFYLLDDYGGRIYKKGGYTEAGNVGIDVLLKTGYFKLSNSYSEMILERLQLNYYSTESFPVRIYYTYIDNNNNAVTSYYEVTMPAETDSNVISVYLPEIYCNDFYIYITNTFSDKFELRSIGVEYEVLRI